MNNLDNSKSWFHRIIRGWRRSVPLGRPRSGLQSGEWEVAMSITRPRDTCSRRRAHREGGVIEFRVWFSFQFQVRCVQSSKDRRGRRIWYSDRFRVDQQANSFLSLTVRILSFIQKNPRISTILLLITFEAEDEPHLQCRPRFPLHVRGPLGRRERRWGDQEENIRILQAAIGVQQMSIFACVSSWVYTCCMPSYVSTNILHIWTALHLENICERSQPWEGGEFLQTNDHAKCPQMEESCNLKGVVTHLLSLIAVNWGLIAYQ